MRKNWLMLAAIGAAATCSPALGEDPVQIGDVVQALSQNSATNTARQIRGGVQYRSPGAFPGTGARPTGAWTAPNSVFLQSIEFDNANGLRKNARGNLLAYNFGSAATGGTLFNLSTNGSNTIQASLAGFTAAFTDESVAQRSASLAVSPDNQHIAGTFFESGRVFVLDYNAGSAIGTGSGASVSNFQKSLPLNSIQHTFATKFLDNDTLIVGYTNIVVPEIATVDFNPVTNTFSAPVPRLQLLPFNGSGNSRYIDIAYEPSVAPYVFVFYSLFGGATENRVSVIDPSTWTEVATYDLSSTVGTSREIAIGPDRHVYVSQFANDTQNTTYVDVIDLDRDNDGDVDILDVISIGNASSNNHATRVPLPAATPLDQGSSFSGIDVALSAPLGVAGPEVVGACCTTVGCLAQITEAACVSFGGTYQGNNSACTNCAPITGACCDVATGACSITSFTACLSANQLYYGDNTLCQPNACDGPGACCLPTGSCVTAQARDCYEVQGGFFQGIGTVCGACPTLQPVLTSYTFDSTNPLPDGRNLSFSVTPDLSGNTPAGTFGNGYTGGNFDVFGLIDRTVNTDFADDTNGTLTQDTFGILYASRTDRVFGVSDLNNLAQGGTGTGTGTATWTFNISGASSLSAEIDFAALGNFELAGANPDAFNFTYSIDGGAPQPLFTSTIQEGSLVYTRMDRGTRVSFQFSEALQDPAAINGIQLRNVFNRISAPIVGTGNVLTISFNASADGAGEIFAFDNLTIRGSTAAPTTGACCLANGMCSITTAAACIGGNFQGVGTSCTPSPCQQPSTGRCCVGARCAIVTAAECVGSGTAQAVFTAGASDCNAPSVLNAPCCFADYNKAGGVTVQDIFDFLTDYFSSSVNANVGGNGTALPTVQDIFDYLTAYFAGGC